VISLWSNGHYTDVPVQTWGTGWSVGSSIVDQLLNTKTAKKLDFVGGGAQYLGVDIQPDGGVNAGNIDISGKETLHLHYYTTNGTACRIKVVDFGADGIYGDNSEMELACPAITQNAWSEMNIDFSTLAAKGHVAQILFVANDVASAQTFYLDNIYFHHVDSGGGGGLTDAPNPTPAGSDVVSLWSNGAYTDVPVATWSTGWSNNASITEHVMQSKTAKQLNFPGGGGAAYVGVDLSAPVSIIGKTHLHFHYFTTDGTEFKVKVVDFGADGAFGGGDDVETAEIAVPSVTQNAWTEADIDVSSLSTTGHIAQLVWVAHGVVPSQTIYLDNIYFH
jgi:hypothetical protein